MSKETHGLPGRAGNRTLGEEVRGLALSLVREKYADFGPTLAAEMLERRDGLKVDHETLRRWMIAAGMWSVARERKHRRKRPPRARRGELVQMDGSHHRWFEDRGPACCLMVMIDDATGERLALFSEQETTEAALKLLRMWLERHGIPQALYVDGRTENTDFGKVCRKLGIRIIRARSPQAKGRVERSNGVFQDPLVKEMRLEDVRDVEGGNRFFDGWIDEHSLRFAKPPADPAPAQRLETRRPDGVHPSGLRPRSGHRASLGSLAGGALSSGGASILPYPARVRLRHRSIPSTMRTVQCRDDISIESRHIPIEPRRPWIPRSNL